MGDYLRTTHECTTLNSMRPELSAAIRAHIEQYELTDAISSALIYCETISTKQKKRLFGRKTEVTIVGILLTPKRLIWAAAKEGEKSSVLSATLLSIRVEDYEKSTMFKIMPDTGLNIFGFQTATGSGSVFVGLGPESAAQKFRTLLKNTIAKA